MHQALKNEELGYSEFFEQNRLKLELNDFPVARVIAQHKGSYKVKNFESEYTAKITGKRLFDATSKLDYPAVGDWVIIEKQDDEQVIIREILPRQSEIKRKSIHKNEIQIIATNIDVAFIVESIGRDFNLNRLERYLALVTDGGIKSTIILNKIDLSSDEDLALKLNELKERFQNSDIILTSTKSNAGLDELKSYIKKGKTYCFLGSSGVGKSSLVNKLLEADAIETKEISLQQDRGRHTTTSREMYFLKSGGIVIDNPGMREVGMTSSNSGVAEIFAEIDELALGCKYTNCAHITEDGCNVLAAISSGDLSDEKYSNYFILKKEAKNYEMAEAERVKKMLSAKSSLKRKKMLKKY